MLADRFTHRRESGITAERHVGGALEELLDQLGETPIVVVRHALTLVILTQHGVNT